MLEILKIIPEEDGSNSPLNGDKRTVIYSQGPYLTVEHQQFDVVKMYRQGDGWVVVDEIDFVDRSSFGL